MHTHKLMNPSDPAKSKVAFKLGKRLRCFCLIRKHKIIPEHCSIILKTTFEQN